MASDMRTGFWHFLAFLALSASTAAAQTGPGRWTSRADGLGSLRAGMRTADVARLVPGTLQPSEGNREDCGYLYVSGVRGLGLMIFGDTVVRFDIDTTTIRTAKGIGVGRPRVTLRDRQQSL